MENREKKSSFAAVSQKKRIHGQFWKLLIVAKACYKHNWHPSGRKTGLHRLFLVPGLSRKLIIWHGVSHEQWENQEFYMEAALQKWTDAWGILLTGICCWGLSSVLPLTKNKRPHSGKWIPKDFSNDPTRLTRRGHVILVTQKCPGNEKIFHLDKKRISQKSPEIEKFHQKAIPSWNFSTPAILPKIASTHPDPKNWKCTCGSSPSALLLDQQSSTWWISWQSKPTAALDHYVAW